MDDSMPVRFRKGQSNLIENVRGKQQRNLRVHVLEIRKGLPVEEFHHQEILAVDVFNRMDGADIGMVEGGGGAGFPLEAFGKLGVLRHLFRKEFQGDAAPEAGIFGFIDNAHAAAGDLACDVVVREGLTDPRLAI